MERGFVIKVALNSRKYGTILSHSMKEACKEDGASDT